jgi:hypothetical protein
MWQMRVCLVRLNHLEFLRLFLLLLLASSVHKFQPLAPSEHQHYLRLLPTFSVPQLHSRLPLN